MSGEHTVVIVASGPYGSTVLVERDGRYSLEGVAPDRGTLLMIARGIIEDATEEERAQIGAEDWY